jgi:hypothetical protein
MFPTELSKYANRHRLVPPIPTQPVVLVIQITFASQISHLLLNDLTSEVNPPTTEVNPDYQFYLGFDNHRQNVNDVFRKDHYGHFMSEYKMNVLIFSL